METEIIIYCNWTLECNVGRASRSSVPAPHVHSFHPEKWLTYYSPTHRSAHIPWLPIHSLSKLILLIWLLLVEIHSTWPHEPCPSFLQETNSCLNGTESSETMSQNKLSSQVRSNKHSSKNNDPLNIVEWVVQQVSTLCLLDVFQSSITACGS